MIILIAESKTMTRCDSHVDENTLAAHRPATDETASRLMHDWGGLSVDSLAEKIKISTQMARSVREMIYDFPDKRSGAKAIEAYTGVVFKAFDYKSLNNDAISETIRSVRIISSLYGILKPDDIIKPYRLDFSTRMAPDNEKMSSFWRDAVTSILSDEIISMENQEVIDLLPADAAQCIDWQASSLKARRWRVEFKTLLPGGGMKTPHSGRLKILRGLLLREAMLRGARSADHLREISNDSFTFYDELSEPGKLVYIDLQQ